ncbi:MAG: hypothetical protein MSG64_03120 [Pyrinomonadaceae bacterium MAG19_C2-C3]|nr:hypothetical protein [Pyrinomonadaceae bacterium MAG19_C2-C3]
MTNRKYLVDTNVISSGALARRAELPRSEQISCVVYTELMIAADAKEFRAYLATWRRAARESRLIAPAFDDWETVARSLHRLAQERKQAAGGKSPSRASAAKQELLADVLIAISARREGIIVVTDDTDFQAIKRHVKGLRVMTPAEFFEW